MLFSSSEVWFSAGLEMFGVSWNSGASAQTLGPMIHVWFTITMPELLLLYYFISVSSVLPGLSLSWFRASEVHGSLLIPRVFQRWCHRLFVDFGNLILSLRFQIFGCGLYHYCFQSPTLWFYYWSQMFLCARLCILEKGSVFVNVRWVASPHSYNANGFMIACA